MRSGFQTRHTTHRSNISLCQPTRPESVGSQEKGGREGGKGRETKGGEGKEGKRRRWPGRRDASEWKQEKGEERR